MAVLKRTLGLTECVFFGVGSILGAGIYTLIGNVAGLSGNFIWQVVNMNMQRKHLEKKQAFS